MNITIFPKIKINVIFLILLLLASYAGFFIEMLLVVFSIIFHEIGHLLFIKLHGGKIDNLHIGIFGGCLDVRVKDDNSRLSKAFIDLAGSNI